MTRFLSLTTATLLLLSVAATVADTGPFTVQSDDASVAASRILASCTNTKKGIFKIQGNSKAKTCAKWAKNGKCNSLVKKESFTVSSVCAKSCVKNTKKGIFKIQGKSKAKTCAKWASKKKCNSLVKKKDYTVSSVCGKSCDHCAAAPTAAPSAAPTVTWKPSSTFAPSATFAPTATWKPTKSPATD